MANITRLTSGATQSSFWQALGGIGIPDPFFYAMTGDDFLPYQSSHYTVTAPNGGSVAAIAGSGGQIQFTTGTTPGNYVSIQQPKASFQYVAGKKLAFLVKFSLADTLNPYGVVGLIQSTTTPNTVTDGFWISKIPGQRILTANITTASVNLASVSYNIPVIPNNTYINVGFVIDRKGNMNIYFGLSVEGSQDQNNVPLGPFAKIYKNTLSGDYTSALLTPTLALTNIGSGTSGVADFFLAVQER